MGQEVVEANATLKDSDSDPSTTKKHAKYVYTREFLLSIADLDHCRQRPAGIDPALLRDTSPALADGAIAIPAVSSQGLIHTEREKNAVSQSPPDVPEWRRPSSLSGSSFLQQGSKRSELSSNNSSPRFGPTWGDNGSGRTNMEKAGGGSSGHGRWEHRSADRERDRSRPYRDRDPKEPSGPLARSHDGLLGSGGPIHQGGLVPIHTRQPDWHHTSGRSGRTGEPYHARGGKVSSFSRREDNDSINDETFGSEEWSNEGRSEQERQRRELFEQMRKEHQKQKFVDSRSKSFQERKQDDSWIWDDGSMNENLLSSSPSTPQSSSSRDEFSKVQSRHGGTTINPPTTPRLLVPPGFSKIAFQRSGSRKENDQISKISSDVDGNFKEANTCQAIRTDKHQDGGTEDEDQPSTNAKDDEAFLQPETSKFARWFGREGNDPTGSLSPKCQLGSVAASSSSFSESFEADTRSEELINRDSSSVASFLPVENQVPVLPMPVGPSLEDVERIITADASSATSGKSSIEQDNDSRYSSIDSHSMLDGNAGLKKKTVSEVLQAQKLSPGEESVSKIPPVFLTCEDLEQHLLAEAVPNTGNEKVENSFGLGEVQLEAKNAQDAFDLSRLFSKRQENPKESAGLQEHGVENQLDAMDDNASRHLMSLLQKGARDSSSALFLQETDPSLATEATVNLSVQGKEINDLEKKASMGTEVSSLEALFGKAFINELRSVEEPVSVKTVAHDPVTPPLEFKMAQHGVGGLDPQFSELKIQELSNPVVPDMHKTLWSGISSHGNDHIVNPEGYVTASPRRKQAGGNFTGDIRQPPSSHSLSHQGGGMFHPQHPEGFFLSNMPPRGIPFDQTYKGQPMHGIANRARTQNDHILHGSISTNAPPVLQDGSFLQAADHLQGQFGYRLSGHPPPYAGAYSMAPPYSPELNRPLNMGFNVNTYIADPRSGGLSFNSSTDQRFNGAPWQSSQGVQGFGTQHPVLASLPEGKVGFHVPEVAMASNGPTTGSLLDKWFNSDEKQLASLPGFDPYAHPGRKLRYG